MQAHEFLLKLRDTESNLTSEGYALRESGRYVDSWSRKTCEGNEQAIVTRAENQGDYSITVQRYPAHRCTALA